MLLLIPLVLVAGCVSQPQGSGGIDLKGCRRTGAGHWNYCPFLEGDEIVCKSYIGPLEGGCNAFCNETITCSNGSVLPATMYNHSSYKCEPIEYEGGCITSEGIPNTLEDRYSCNFIHFWGKTSTGYVVHQCFKAITLKNEPQGLYMVDMHPGPAAMITYILEKDGNEQEVISESELIDPLTPISSDDQALEFVILSKGLWTANETEKYVDPPTEESSVSKTVSGWNVHVIHSERSYCPCYGRYYESNYTVTSNGTVTEVSEKVLYSFGVEETGCVC